MTTTNHNLISKPSMLDGNRTLLLTFVVAVIEAPKSNKRRQISLWPFVDAQCKGVHPD